MEPLVRAPSSRGLDPWEFILVDDPALLSGLSELKQHGAEFLAGTPLAVAVIADPEQIRKASRPKRYIGTLINKIAYPQTF